MSRIELHFKSDEYITGKIKTKLDVATSRFNHYAEATKNAKDADEHTELLKKLYEEERKMDILWKEAVFAYRDDVGTDTQRLFADADYMIKQVNYDYITSSYSVHIALNSLEKSAERIKLFREQVPNNFLFSATIDDIKPENMDGIIAEVQRSCFHRVLDEQLFIIQSNYEPAEGQEIAEQLAQICRQYVFDLIEAAGGIDTFINDLHDKIAETKEHIVETEKEKENGEEERKEPVDIEAIQLEMLNNDLIYMPTSPHLHILQALQSNRTNLPEYALKKNRANKRNELSISRANDDKILYKKGDNNYFVVQVKGKETITITLPELQKQIKSNRPATNMLTFLLPQIEKQAFNSAGLYSEHISFNLQDLVDIGMYSDIRSARRGNEAAAEALKDIKISVGGENGAFVMATIFPTIEKTENNICTYHINPQINWTNLLKYHYQLPTYYYRLPTKAQDLLNNLVAYLARQNADLIREKGYFSIKLRQVQAELTLPDEHKTKDVNGKIKTPIVEAIKAINEADAGRFYKLELHVDKNARPTQYLDTGYIRVYPLNEVKDHIIEVKDKRDKIIERNTKRLEGNKDKAQINAFEKQIAEGKNIEDITGGN